MTISEFVAALGTLGVAHAGWLLVGVIVVAVFVLRRSDRSETHLKAAVHWMEGALAEAPDKLYASVHPNWSVYRKQIGHRLRAAVPELSTPLLQQVLAEFDACYELSDGVYIRIGCAADESRPHVVEDFTPLVAPVEGFRLRKVQARRRWRRVRAVTASIVIYIVVVTAGLWILVMTRTGMS